ncbi:lipid droplet-associated hydrolase-like [Rhodnius prolixus]|uniref:Lipid droplet-associated hydrolase n=1 Tax=Rhodnius prolixus TaxID=13249 RepID=R4G835_RHOPR
MEEGQENDGVRQGWVMVNGVPTFVKTWGCWLNQSSAKDVNDAIVLCIPAAPGITDFYDKFLSTLHAELHLPVWVVCHAGIQSPPATTNLALPPLHRHPHLYNLAGQVEHKQKFIDQYLPKDKFIHFIGHSIGAKICIELMKVEEIASRTKQIHLLFPAIQQLADTPKGWQFTNIWNKLSPLLVLLAFIFTSLPYCVRCLLVRIAIAIRLFVFKIEPCYITAVIKLCNPESTRNVFFLGESGMSSVRGLDDEIYTKYHQHIRAYFSVSDSWVPLKHYNNLRKQHPKVKSLLLEPMYIHDFIIQTSEQMAHKISLEFKTFVTL